MTDTNITKIYSTSTALPAPHAFKHTIFLKFLVLKLFLAFFADFLFVFMRWTNALVITKFDCNRRRMTVER